MSKYDPLARHLRRQTSDTVEMTFRDLELVLRAMLPRSAERPQWWANEKSETSRHVQSRAWLSAGFDAFLLKGQERVRFVRQTSASRPASMDA